MKVPSSLKEAMGQFGPLAAIGVALAIFVTAVPSTGGGSSRVDSLDLSGGLDPAELTAGADGTVGSTGATTPGASPAAGGAGAASSAGTSGGGGSRAAGSSTPEAVAANPSSFDGEDCSRRAQLGAEYPCRPVWTGSDNGGATARGVTEDSIRIVVYGAKGDPQVDAILKQAGVADPEATKRAIGVHNEWFNLNYELYGRTVEVIVQRGPGDSTPAQQQADAIMIAEELKAFAMVCVSCTPAVHQELARRGVLSLTGIMPTTQKFLEEAAPYMFSILPETEVLFTHFAEYYCKKLLGGNADFAGAGIQGQERKLGIIYIESEYTNLGDDLSGFLERECGYKPIKTVGYPPDITRAAEIATNAIAQMRTAGATAVTCVCDPVAPLFITTEATKQAYFPEWIHNGFFGTDSDIAGRNYDQQQWTHSYGPSSISYYAPLSVSGAWNAYWQTKGSEGTYDDAVAGGLEFLLLSVVLRAIEASGPAVTYEGVIRNLLTSPPNPSKPQPWGGFSVSSSFGTQPGVYSAIDDFMEIWWNGNGEAPHGLYPASSTTGRGYLFYVNGGKRYRAGEWPAGPPNVFVDDGSRQPAPDPQARCKCYQP